MFLVAADYLKSRQSSDPWPKKRSQLLMLDCLWWGAWYHRNSARHPSERGTEWNPVTVHLITANNVCLCCSSYSNLMQTNGVITALPPKSGKGKDCVRINLFLLQKSLHLPLLVGVLYTNYKKSGRIIIQNRKKHLKANRKHNIM